MARGLNLVERGFAELTNKRIRRLSERQRTGNGIREFIEVHNEDPKPFVWTRTTDQILDSIACYARSTLWRTMPELNREASAL
jgi:hypothetical protein